MEKNLVFLDTVLLQQDMRIRLPKSILVNVEGKAGKNKVRDIFLMQTQKKIILKKSPNI